MSPDGKWVVYGGDAEGNRDIFLQSTTGQTPINLTSDSTDDEDQPAFSPDGERIAFRSSRDGSGRGGSINLWRVPIDEASVRTMGPPEAVITPSPFAAHIAVSADGTRIAYSSILRSRNIQKMPIDPDTGAPRGEPTWITTGSRLWANPDPSPDGKWVAFYSSVQPEGDLYVVRTDGTGMRQLTMGAGELDRMPRWSPDGQWIAFHSIRSKDQHLWQIRPDGSDRRQLSPLADAIYPAWSPDGSQIAVLMAAGIGHPANDVYVFDPRRPWSEQQPTVIASPAGGRDVFVVNAWSPDGSQLAGQVGLEARGILTYSLRSRTFDRLTDFGGYPCGCRTTVMCCSSPAHATSTSPTRNHAGSRRSSRCSAMSSGHRS